jgi:hypothetical protein
MVRLCNLAEPTGPARVSGAYLYVVSLGRGVFHQAAKVKEVPGVTVGLLVVPSILPDGLLGDMLERDW